VIVDPRSGQDGELEELVRATARGDEDAWRNLWHSLEPRLAGMVARRRFGAHLARRDDDRRDVVVKVMAHLRTDGFHRLKRYLAARRADPALTFMRWLSVVAKRVAIDCLRAHPDYLDHRRKAIAPDAPGTWIRTQPLPSDRELSGGRPPITNRVTARQILRYATGALSGEQRRALELWAEQRSAAEIATALGLADADQAERLVHAAIERLRRHFRQQGAT
jgi:hypothetical protein